MKRIRFALPAIVFGGLIALFVNGLQRDPTIVESPFMRSNAKTLAYRHELTLEGDRLGYKQTTLVAIYGKEYEHTDQYVLNRVS